MSFFLRSIATRSFWKYALFSGAAFGKLLAVVGSMYLFMELMDFLSIYTKDQYSKWAIGPILLVSLLYVIVTRRPVKKVIYRAGRKDLSIEVKIGDLFSESGDVIISSNTTFDTNVSSGLISPDSLQGQFSSRVFHENTAEIDRQLAEALATEPFKERPDAPGKRHEYAMGTVAKLTMPGKTYYLVAMSRLSDQGTAASSIQDVESALSNLWAYVAAKGELRNLVVPIMGTGRGRIPLPRKKIIERIAQSFVDASREKVFSNRLTIVIRPEDADRYSINLFEVRDYLTHSLDL